MEKPRTKEEHSAATCIQLWYRRCVDRKNSRLVKNLLVQQWAECAADVSEIKLVDDTVRLSYWVKMVRGPLPHVLCVVETLLLVVRKIKDTAKRRLPKAVHLELETIRDTQNITTKVYKELLAGRKMISPKHEIFRAGNLMGLRKGVREVERLLLECRSFAKPGDVDGLESHMKCGIKGIITNTR
ncbi:hypothetical protein BS47DRAFT_108671 [Hydnum rufescens UP504]|uniref:Uncharacterized protein n=1 Tax=Hydnum rufescens UP504 TaxID=1448309 RepID=A0A9P6AQ27_9AGAM|nr:hypothetical protein BS47DRAFT_108671 [Hydnum rufescens UP504]